MVGLDDNLVTYLVSIGGIARKIETYLKFREYFTPEQQRVFDSFLLLTNDDDQFFQMCLAYQNDQKNNVKIDIKNMEIL